MITLDISVDLLHCNVKKLGHSNVFLSFLEEGIGPPWTPRWLRPWSVYSVMKWVITHPSTAIGLSLWRGILSCVCNTTGITVKNGVMSSRCMGLKVDVQMCIMCWGRSSWNWTHKTESCKSYSSRYSDCVIRKRVQICNLKLIRSGRVHYNRT